MIYLKSVKAKGFPFYYVEVDQNKLNELKKLAQTAEDPEIQQGAIEAL